MPVLSVGMALQLSGHPWELLGVPYVHGKLIVQLLVQWVAHDRILHLHWGEGRRRKGPLVLPAVPGAEQRASYVCA